MEAIVSQYGLIGFILVVLVTTGIRKDWVFGWLYREVQARCDAEIAKAEARVAAAEAAKERWIDMSFQLSSTGREIAAVAKDVVAKGNGG